MTEQELGEEVAKFLGEQYHPHQEFTTLSDGVREDLLYFADQIHALYKKAGYVKLAEKEREK